MTEGFVCQVKEVFLYHKDVSRLLRSRGTSLHYIINYRHQSHCSVVIKTARKTLLLHRNEAGDLNQHRNFSTCSYIREDCLYYSTFLFLFFSKMCFCGDADHISEATVCRATRDIMSQSLYRWRQYPHHPEQSKTNCSQFIFFSFLLSSLFPKNI